MSTYQPLTPRLTDRLTHRLRLRLRRAGRTDLGAVTMLVVIVTSGLLAVAGLVYDGSQKMRAARAATTSAAEAARAATQALTPAAITGRPSDVDASAGARAGRAYLAAAGVNGTVSVFGDTVTVHTTVPWQPKFLSIIGIGPQNVTGDAAARTTRR